MTQKTDTSHHRSEISSNDTDTQFFLELLEKEARRQALLAKHSPLPHSLHVVSAYVATHVWQVSLVCALFTAAVIEVFSL